MAAIGRSVGGIKLASDSEPPQLSEHEVAQWNAMRQSLDALADQIRRGVVTADDLIATAAQLSAIRLDMDRVRDSLEIPEDAGPLRDELVALMLRIPDGWGRWVSCDAGWYPLITALDAKIAAIAPDYVLNQVKEKYGRLRYYIDIPEMTWSDPRRQQVEQLIRQAEEESASTCERCGERDAMLHVSHSWYKTLCARCANFVNEQHGRAFRAVR